MYENIASIFLSNNEFLNNSYDKLMSMNGDPEKKFKIYLAQGPKETKTYNRLNELERYQRKIRRGHSRMKRRLIGMGKNMTPHYSRPNYKRSKSAPPGFGGS